MKLDAYPGCHLTYCTNIHAGESWVDVFSQLKSNLPELKRRIARGKAFGVGLRLSDLAARELLEGDQLDEFADWLDSEKLYVFTINGFPFGSFHGREVKDNVYVPDWREEARVAYTGRLVSILARLLPEGMDGGISTSPLSYKYWMTNDEELEDVFLSGSRNLARIAWQMATLREKTGKELHLDIEPEPDCILENSSETVVFFTNWLFEYGSEYLAGEYGVSRGEARSILQFHIRLCYDTCHFAVEFEEPETAIRKMVDAGIRIGKTQISAALKIALPDDMQQRTMTAGRLQSFDEPTYLHQVVEKRADGGLQQYRDLGQALPHISDPDAREWRIHFHVPVFVDRFAHKGAQAGQEQFASTQSDIIKSLEVLLTQTDCRHYEIETYTWDVLPESLKVDLVDSIEREFNWVLDQFAGNRSGQS